MKLLLVSMLTVFAMQAHATKLKDILIPIIIGAATGHSPYGPYPQPGYPGNPGGPGHGPGHGPGYPGGPGQYPGNPGYGNVQCSAADAGWEEHAGGHYSCGDCVRWHGQCVETCREVAVECQATGSDNFGRPYTFMGRGYDQYSAQNDAVYNCQSRNFRNCYVTGCQQRQNIVSQRSCR